MPEMTSAARTLYVSGEGADCKLQYDAQVKAVLSDKWFLAWILHDTVREFHGMPPDRIREYIEGEPVISREPVDPGLTSDRISGGAAEDSVPSEGIVTFDILFDALCPVEDEDCRSAWKSRDLNGMAALSEAGPGPLDRGDQMRSIPHRIKLILNVEAQKSSDPGYSLVRRGIYYCARLLSRQKDREFTGSHYDDLKKVYSIWICFSCARQDANTITNFRLCQEDLVGRRQDRGDYDLMTVSMICLGSEPHYEKDTLIGMLEVTFSDKLGIAEKQRRLKDDFGIPMTAEVTEGMKNMCNLSDLVEERGIQKGIEQGIEKGIERGIEKGIEKGVVQGMQTAAQRMFAAGQTADEISAILCEDTTVVEQWIHPLQPAE